MLLLKKLPVSFFFLFASFSLVFFPLSSTLAEAAIQHFS